MTGHYETAEALLTSCQIDKEGVIEFYPAVEDGVNSTGNALAAAQVHATLALVRAVEQLTEFVAYDQRARAERGEQS